MKKVKIATGVSDPLHTAVLEDFSHFEAKMTRIKHLKAAKENLDKSFLLAAIDSLALKGKKITPKRVKKICKRALVAMIEEAER